MAQVKGFVLGGSVAEEEEETPETRWLLNFASPVLEAEYFQEVDAKSRRPFMATVFVSIIIMFVEFWMSSGVERISNQDIAARCTAYSRVVGFGAACFCVIVGMRRCVSFENLALAFAMLLTMLMFTSNAFRMSELMGTEFYHHEFMNCGADVCYDDTSVFLGLACISCGAQIFVSVRSVKSWTLPLVQAAAYAAVSLSGLGPLTRMATLAYVAEYTTLMAFIWTGCFWVEAQARQRWVENRRLRTQVETHKDQIEAWQRRLWDIEERIEAMSIASDAPSRLGKILTDSDTSVVPPPPRLPANLHPPLRGAADTFPNPVLVEALAGQEANRDVLRRMAERIHDEDYGMKDFFQDSLAAFPELGLFYALHCDDEDVPATKGGRSSTQTSSGRAPEEEYQRTIGALFAVYWLLRLDSDGKSGFCFGVDKDWEIRTGGSEVAADHSMGLVGSLRSLDTLRDVIVRNGAKSELRRGSTSLDIKAKQPLTPWQKRVAFYEEMDWGSMDEVASLAVGTSVERIEAMLCLTAFHDIMKVPELCPRVAPEHAPYQGYQARDLIHDHDIALAYVLDHFPDLLPSYAILPSHSKEVVLFTQQKMNFNHGWFVQAEGSPGAMLSNLKQVLKGAHPGDLAFYFFHWLTDLSGAEGNPLAGAEKFVLKFPREVLQAFIWSIPFIQKLQDEPETGVVEKYLVARWQATFATADLPAGPSAVARMRLAVMAQSGAPLALEAFDALPKKVRRVLEDEMARTGVHGQVFRSSPVGGGPAFLVYYGPALLQRCQTIQEMTAALNVLSAVFRAGRMLWPACAARQGETVTLEVSRMKADRSRDPACAIEGEVRSIWLLVQRNRREAAVELAPAGAVNEYMAKKAKVCGVDVAVVGSCSILEDSSDSDREAITI